MKSKQTSIVIAVLIPVFSIIIALGLVYFKKSNLSGIDEFPYQKYIEASADIEGNRYLLNAIVIRQLENLGDRGRVVSVLPDNADGAELAILIPQKMIVNVSTNQRYRILVEIAQKGRIVAHEMRKF